MKFLLTSTGIDSLKLTTVEPEAEWPFPQLRNRRDIIVKPGANVAYTRPKGEVKDTLFHYTITGICNRDGGGKDTVVVDPIMILPK